VRTPQQRRMEQARRRYTVLRRQFLEDNPACAICTDEGAPTRSTEVHHMRGRGLHFLAVETWLPICRSHHERVTLNPKWALEAGWSLPRIGRAS
jgi:hypothetical protein